MSGLTRQEMKRDEVQEQLLVGVEWFREHWKKLAAGLVALLVAVSAFFVLRMVLEQRSDKAQAALGDALRLVTAPVVEDGATPDDARNPSFPDAASRDERALAALEEVVGQYGSSDAAQIAQLLVAQRLATRGDTAQAREIWQAALRDGKGTARAATARANLISLDRQERPQELADELQEMVDAGNSELPPDALLFELAQTLEAAGRDDEAAEVYRRIVDEFQSSAFAAQARTRIQS
jgi:tetratricopeptide (TPR) repeat protein